ncbi:hypothetical protein KUCAC02_004260, partial [Chaenocephalus aceratus]
AFGQNGNLDNMAVVLGSLLKNIRLQDSFFPYFQVASLPRPSGLRKPPVTVETLEHSEMKSQWKGQSPASYLHFLQFSSAPEPNRDSPDSATVTFPPLKHSQISSHPRSSTWVERSSRESLFCGKRGGGRLWCSMEHKSDMREGGGGAVMWDDRGDEMTLNSRTWKL